MQDMIGILQALAEQFKLDGEVKKHGNTKAFTIRFNILGLPIDYFFNLAGGQLAMYYEGGMKELFRGVEDSTVEEVYDMCKSVARNDLMKTLAKTKS